VSGPLCNGLCFHQNKLRNPLLHPPSPFSAMTLGLYHLLLSQHVVKVDNSPDWKWDCWQDLENKSLLAGLAPAGKRSGVTAQRDLVLELPEENLSLLRSRVRILFIFMLLMLDHSLIPVHFESFIKVQSCPRWLQHFHLKSQNESFHFYWIQTSWIWNWWCIWGKRAVIEYFSVPTQTVMCQ
jgi:hypothetical protein